MISDKVTKLTLDFYNTLKKTGKPTNNEWTVLSSIVIETKNKFEVIALGTGTKCIGRSQMCSDGVKLNDSHAEVICRRAFVRFLYNEMLKDDSDILYQSTDKDNLFCLVDGVKFHMYSSLMPCGDASIFPKDNNQLIDNDNTDYGTVLLETKPLDGQLNNFEALKTQHNLKIYDSTTCTTQSDSSQSKRIKLDLSNDADIHRTGAKCLENDINKDKKLAGSDYHVLGAVRTKPGRGDPTISVSCSDKLSKWIELGIQGNLLSLLLAEPIYLASITIGNEVFCKNALERALFKRFESKIELGLKSNFKQHIPDLFHCNKFRFNHNKGDLVAGLHSEKQPAPGSIIYIKNSTSKSEVEVAVDGFKQGVTKKNRLKPTGRLSICKLELFKCFVRVLKVKNVRLGVDCTLPYGAFKKTTDYSACWMELKKKKFKVWPVKNLSLEDFVINNLE